MHGNFDLCPLRPVKGAKKLNPTAKLEYFEGLNLQVQSNVTTPDLVITG
jgi:hypothetical protein